MARPRSESLQTTERRHKLLICCFYMWTDARIDRGDSVANELDHVVRHSCSVHDKYGCGKTNVDIFPYLKKGMSSCKPEVTIPGILKRILWDPHATDSSVCCSDTQCTKTFADADVYARELSIYQKNLPYVPRLISHDQRTRTIVTERVGTPLGTVWTSGIPFIGPFLRSASQWKQNCSIRRLHKKFRKDTGLYHNDIAYKNVLRDEKGGLYLIDFENADVKRRETDADEILRRTGPPDIVLKLIVFAVIAIVLIRLR